MDLRRLLRYRLRTLLIVMFAVAVYFGYRDYLTRQLASKRLVRQLVGNELMKAHWQGMETNRQMLPLVDRLLDDFDGDEKFELTYFAAPAGTTWLAADPTPTDPFTTRAVRRIANGEDQVWRFRLNGDVQYVAPVQSTASCQGCHKTAGGGAPANFGLVSAKLSQ